MRILLATALAVGLAACTSARSHGGGADPGTAEPGPSAAPLPSAPREVQPGGPLDAASLAREMGLRYEDRGSSVSLSGPQVLARFYPGSDRMTIDGRSYPMGSPARRGGGGLVVPPDGADLVRRAASDARARIASAPKVQPLVPLNPPPAVPKPILVPVEIPVATAKAVAGDPSWTSLAAAERPWRYIVIHHSDDHEGCMAKYDRVHLQKGWENGCGYHFVVGNGSQSGDGEIEMGPRWIRQQQGAHAKTDDNRFNDYGVGVCLVGDFENGGRPTERQYQATVRLTRWLMARYGVSVDRVLRHQDCKSTACPGRFFPWNRFLADVAGGSSMAVPP
jgi:hypothetical protein